MKNNGNNLQISKCLFRVLLSKKEKRNAENCREIANYLELIDDFGNLKMN
jgi:hypothetical protein